MPNAVRLHRVLATRPEKVYRAFLEADALAKWLPPNGFACTVHHLEPKVGGKFKMSFRNFTSGIGHSFGGEYVELVPNERLRYTDKFDAGAPHRAGRPAGRNSGGGVLSGVAGVAAKLGKARGAGNQSITHRQTSSWVGLGPCVSGLLPATEGTSRLSTVRSPSPPLDMTTTSTGLLCRRIGVRWFEEQGAVSDCGAYVFRLKILGSI